jgi:hypothetical protein
MLACCEPDTKAEFDLCENAFLAIESNAEMNVQPSEFLAFGYVFICISLKCKSAGHF